MGIQSSEQYEQMREVPPGIVIGIIAIVIGVGVVLYSHFKYDGRVQVEVSYEDDCKEVQTELEGGSTKYCDTVCTYEYNGIKYETEFHKPNPKSKYANIRLVDPAHPENSVKYYNLDAAGIVAVIMGIILLSIGLIHRGK